MRKKLRDILINYKKAEVGIYPLVSFRIFMGLLLLCFVILSVYKNDLQLRYIEPSFFFQYYWTPFISKPDPVWIYVSYGVLTLSACGILLGCCYRLAVFAAFISFNYLHLLDATNYINHYYLIGLLLFYLFFLPAGSAFSIDSYWKQQQRIRIAQWQVDLLKAQFSIVYFYAGLAKVNPDWLGAAMPLKHWLLQQADIPLVGQYLGYTWLAFIASYFAALYDLSIGFLLWFKRWRTWAYIFVLLFHGLTGLLFDIGLFPWLMIGGTLIFFPNRIHQSRYPNSSEPKVVSSGYSHFVFYGLLCSLVIQFLLPLRGYFYKGNILWHKQGYWLSWRVMLVESRGMTTFYVEQKSTGRRWEVDNLDFLREIQIKRMHGNADHILQFAHYLQKLYSKRLDIPLEDLAVYVDAYLALNGRMSKQFVDPSTDLAQETWSWRYKDWILQ